MQNIFKKNISYNVLGLMTGTSMDGVDISYIKTNGTNYFKIINEKSYQFSKKYQKELKKIIDYKSTSKNQLIKYFYSQEDKINTILIYFIQKYLKEFNINNKKIDLISLSGQTVYHNPRKKISIQLGSGKFIANKTNIRTISNLREKDIKNGGQGAPIGSYYHRYLLKLFKKKSIILNLGGIANFSIIVNNNIYSSDIGPANCLIDDLCNYFYKIKYDKNGINASKGNVNKMIINNFKKDPFFKKNFPKSLDRNYFKKYFKRLIKIKRNDAICTATYMIFLGIEKLVKCKKFNFNNIILTGGGRKNNFLIKILKENLDKKIEIIDKYNRNGDLIESQMFAYIGVRSLKNLIISTKYTTGVKKSISGGKIFYPN